MKKYLSCIVIMMIILFLNGCANNNITEEETQIKENFTEEKIAAELTPASIIDNLGSFSNWEEDIPKNARELETINVDLEGDGMPEIAVKYKNPQVQARYDQTREIRYLNIYKKENNLWIKIKTDEATIANGSVDSDFCIFQKINFGNDKKEELLVSKCGLGRGAGLNGYYIFGKTPDGHIQDLEIPKGYLHADQLLQPGDKYANFEYVTTTEKSINEKYLIDCPSRDSFAGHFGDQDGGYCRQVILSIPYANGVFSEPITIENKNLIYTKPFRTSTLDRITPESTTEIEFDLPVWLVPSPATDSWPATLTANDHLSKFYFNFGYGLETLRGFRSPGDKSEEQLDKSLTPKDVDKFINDFCLTMKETNKDLAEGSCVADNNVMIIKRKRDILMMKIFADNKSSVVFVTQNDKRDLNYFDEAVMKTMIDSFKIINK